MSAFDPNIRNLLDKLELEQKVHRITQEVLSDHAHDHQGSDPHEAADDTPDKVDQLRGRLRDELGIFAGEDIVQDLKQLMDTHSWSGVLQDVVLDNVDPYSAHDVMATAENQRGILNRAESITSAVRQSLLGALDKQYAQDADRAQEYLTGLVGRGVGRVFSTHTELGRTHFGTPDSSRVPLVRGMLERDVSARSTMVSATAGLAVLDAILSAKKSVAMGMYQLEHGLVLQALHHQQQMGRQINLMLQPYQIDGEYQKVGGLNILARNLLGGTSVRFDEEVTKGIASHAHYKFLGIDLDQNDYQTQRVIVGSFNMTQGALGQIIDRQGRLLRRSPNNLEFGFNVGWESVTRDGMRRETFHRIIDEARDYSAWLMDRSNKNRLKPLGYNPEHILSGPQTWERINRSLGSDTGYKNKVEAFLIVNQLSESGFDTIYNPIEATLRENRESTVTLFVSHGFTDQKTGASGETSYTPEVLRRLRLLEWSSMGRFQVVEVGQYMHGKGAIVFRHEGGDIITDTVGGTANYTGSGLRGGNNEVSLYLSSRNFDRVGRQGTDYLTEQSYYMLRRLMSLAVSPPGSLARSNLAARSNASRMRLMEELKLRLNPDLLRMTTIQDIRDPSGAVGDTNTVGSLVKLSLRIKHKGLPVTWIHDAFQFRILEYGRADRLYIPELSKVIDPVLSMSAQQTSDVRTGRMVRVLEHDSAAVVAAALDQMVTQLNEVSTAFVQDMAGIFERDNPARFRSMLMDYLRPTGVLGNHLKRMANEIFRSSFEHFEGLPQGKYATDARVFRRLVYGTIFKDIPGEAPAGVAEYYKQLQKSWGGPGKSAAMLSMNNAELPRLTPESMEATFYQADWEILNEIGSRQIGGNAPQEVVRRRGGKFSREKLFYTLMAQSLPHEGPAFLFLNEGFNYMAATDWDEATQTFTGFLRADKPAQLAQRFQNLTGADSSFLMFPASVAADMARRTNLRRVVRPVAGRSEASRDFKVGLSLNVGLVLGLGESSLMNADVFRDTTQGRTKVETITMRPWEIPMDNGELTGTLFDGRLRMSATKANAWERYEDGKWVEATKGPLLTIGSDEAQLRTFYKWAGDSLDPVTLKNPIHGHEGAFVTIDAINKLPIQGGGIEYHMSYTIHSPTSSNMRMYSQGAKMVPVGVKGQFFEKFSEFINEGIDRHQDEALGITVTEGGKQTNIGLGSFGGYYTRTLTALGMNRDDLKGHQAHLDSMRLHMMMGESVVKTGVIFLHTAATLLRDAEWRRHFSSLFSDTKSLQRFDTLMGHLVSSVTNEKEIFEKEGREAIGRQNRSWLLDRFAIHGLDALLTSDSDLAKAMDPKRLPMEERLRLIQDTLQRFDGPEFVVQTLQDKAVLRMAAAYHVIQSLRASELMNNEFVDASYRLGGRPLMGVPNLNLKGFVPLKLYDEFAADAYSMSDRGTANFLTNYSGIHAETILRAVNLSPEVERRTRQFAEILRIGYLGGTATQVVRSVLKQTGRDVFESVAHVEGIRPMVGGVHWSPFSYAWAGMGHDDQQKMIRLNEIIEKIAYGADGREVRPFSEEARAMQAGSTHANFMTMRAAETRTSHNESELDTLRQEASRLIGELGESKLKNGSVYVKQISQAGDDILMSFNLRRAAGVGAAILRFPVIHMEQTADGSAFLAKSIHYEQISMLSPATATQLQSFEDFLGPMLRAQAEIERNTHVFGTILKQIGVTGGFLSVEMRDRYTRLLDQINELKTQIQAAGTTNIQKTLAVMNTGGMAMIANTIPGFHNMVVGSIDDPTGKSAKAALRLEDVIVLGDEAMNFITGEAMKALAMARRMTREFVLTKPKDSAERVEYEARMAGVQFAYKGHRFRTNALSLPQWILDRSGALPGTERLSVADIAGAIQDNFNTYRDAVQNARRAHMWTRRKKLLGDIVEIEERLDGPHEQLADASDGENINKIQSRIDRAWDRLGRAQARVEHINTEFGVQGQSTTLKPVVDFWSQQNLEYMRGMHDIFALRVQQAYLNGVAKKPGMHAINPLVKDKLSDIHSHLQILSYDQQHRTELETHIFDIQDRLNNATLRPSERRQLNKLLEIALGQREQLDQGRTSTSAQLLLGATDSDLLHTLGALGVDTTALFGQLDKNYSVSGGDGSLMLKKMTSLLDSGALMEIIQDAQYLQDGRIVSGLTRAGSPVGVGGVTGKPVISVRQLNYHMRQLGSSFEIDETMSRRSMFLHMSGMALFLGDFDGDNAIIGTLKRYTLLKSLHEQLGQEGLTSLQIASQERVDHIKKMSQDRRQTLAAMGYAIEDYEMFTGNLYEEYTRLHHQVTYGQRQVLFDHIESYLGIGEGAVENITAAIHKNRWSEYSREDQLRLMGLTATKLNSFADDVYTGMAGMARDLVMKELKSEGVYAADYDTADIGEGTLDRIFRSKKFRDAAQKIYTRSFSADSLIQKALAPTLDPAKMDPEKILGYAIQVAFSSTKLIGNFTNVQTLNAAFNVHNKVATYQSLSELRKQVGALKNGKDQEFAEQLEAKLDSLSETHQKFGNNIHKRVSGWLQRLQQAARDAIKLKAAADDSTDNRSPLQVMMEDPINRSLELVNGLIRGKSFFGTAMPEFNTGFEEHQALFAGLNPADVVAVTMGDDGKVQAQFNRAYENQPIYDQFIAPMLEAGTMMAEAAFKLESKFVAAEDQAALKQKLTDAYMTSSLVSIRTMLQNREPAQEYYAYKKALQGGEDTWDVARSEMEDHMKLIFLHEEARGGRLKNAVQMKRVLNDVAETFIIGHNGTDYLMESARQVDPTGRLMMSLRYIADGVQRGMSEDSIFAVVKRSDTLYYRVLDELQTEMLDAFNVNPAADVANMDRYAVEHGEALPKNRAMSEGGIVKPRGPVKPRMAPHEATESRHFSGLLTVLPALVTGGVFLDAGTSQAAQVITGQRPNSDQGQMLGRAAEYGALMALAWTPLMAMKQMDLLAGMDKGAAMAGKLMFGAAMGAGHVAATLATRSEKMMRGLSKLPNAIEKSSSLLSMATMMAVGHALGSFINPMLERERMRPDVQMTTRIVEAGASAADALSSALELYTSDLGAPADNLCITVDENGDPVPGDVLTESMLDAGITTPEGYPIIPGKQEMLGIEDVYSKPPETRKRLYNPERIDETKQVRGMDSPGNYHEGDLVREMVRRVSPYLR